MKQLLTILLVCIATLNASALPFKEVVVALDNYNPQLQIARAQMICNKVSQKTERNQNDPEVELEVMSPAGDPDIEFTFSQEFNFPVKYFRLKKVERLLQKKDSIEYDITRREVIASAYEICADIIYLNHVLLMDSMRYDMAKTIYERLKKGLDGGKFNILELNDSHIAMITAFANLCDSRRELSEKKLALKALFGNETIVEIKDMKYPEGLTICDNYGRIYDELRAVEAELNAMQFKVAKCDAHPNLTAGYKMAKAGDETAHGFIVGASLPILSPRGKKDLAKAESTISNLEIYQRAAELEEKLSTEHHKAEDYQQLLGMFDPELFNQTPALLKKSLDSGRITEIEYTQQLSNWYDNNKVYLEQVKEYNKCMLIMAAYCY